MRLSADRNSPFYDEAKVESRPLVFVDGARVDLCLEASEEEGWADVYVTDDVGKKILNAAGDGAEYQRLYGKVEFRPRD